MADRARLGLRKANRFGLTKGLVGQQRLWSNVQVDRHRANWHVQRLYWFDWRDPPPGAPEPCSFCPSAGLLASTADSETRLARLRSSLSGQGSEPVAQARRGGRPGDCAGRRTRGVADPRKRRRHRTRTRPPSRVLRDRPGNQAGHPGLPDDADDRAWARTGSCSSGATWNRPSEGSFNWGPTDALIGAFASHGIRPCRTCGEALPGWPGRRRRPPIDTRGPRGVAGVPRRPRWRATGPTAAYWVHRLQEAYGDDAVPLPDPVVAGLERAQPERSTSPRAHRPRSTPGSSRCPTTRSRARTRTPRSCSPECPATATSTPGSSWTSCTRQPGVKDNFDAAALHPYAPDIAASPARDPAGPRGDGRERRSGDATVDHRDRVGIGAAGPVRDQQGAAVARTRC